MIRGQNNLLFSFFRARQDNRSGELTSYSFSVLALTPLEAPWYVYMVNWPGATWSRSCFSQLLNTDKGHTRKSASSYLVKLSDSSPINVALLKSAPTVSFLVARTSDSVVSVFP